MVSAKRDTAIKHYEETPHGRGKQEKASQKIRF